MPKFWLEMIIQNLKRRFNESSIEFGDPLDSVAVKFNYVFYANCLPSWGTQALRLFLQ